MLQITPVAATATAATTVAAQAAGFSFRSLEAQSFMNELHIQYVKVYYSRLDHTIVFIE